MATTQEVDIRPQEVDNAPPGAPSSGMPPAQQPQQQPAFSQPAASGAGKQEPTGFNMESIGRYFTSIPGILRAVEFVFAIIAFGAMSNTSHYSHFSAFQYLVAIGVMTWLAVIFFIIVNILGLPNSNRTLVLAEFVDDVFFAFMNFIAGIAAAAKCNSSDDGITICSSSGLGSKPRAAAAFAFLLSFCLMASTYFSVKRWRGQ